MSNLTHRQNCAEFYPMFQTVLWIAGWFCNQGKEFLLAIGLQRFKNQFYWEVEYCGHPFAFPSLRCLTLAFMKEGSKAPQSPLSHGISHSPTSFCSP